ASRSSARFVDPLWQYQMELFRPSLRQYAGGGGLRTCFKIPSEIEAQITNLRQEYLATLKILSERSGVSPKQKGLLFENAMEILAEFKNAHAAAA
ncbi:hypothetical protein, partial [Xanthomonas floridensis]